MANRFVRGDSSFTISQCAPRPTSLRSKARRSVVIVDHDVDCAVVIDVAKSNPAADLRALKRRASQVRDFAKAFPASFVVKQLAALGVREVARLIRSDDRDGAVGDEQIEPAVVIVIEPSRAETGVAERRLQKAEIAGGVIELAAGVAAKHGDALAREVSDQQDLAPVVFDVPERDSHAGLGEPVHAVGDAHIERGLTKRAITLIEPQAIRGGIVRDVDIRTAITVEVGADHAESRPVRHC